MATQVSSGRALQGCLGESLTRMVHELVLVCVPHTRKDVWLYRDPPSAWWIRKHLCRKRSQQPSSTTASSIKNDPKEKKYFYLILADEGQSSDINRPPWAAVSYLNILLPSPTEKVRERVHGNIQLILALFLSLDLFSEIQHLNPLLP